MERLQQLVATLFPGSKLERVGKLGVDEAAGADGAATEKGVGYGTSKRLTVCDRGGRMRDLVFHTATANDFGHDRRSDRAAELLLSFDTFASIPRHVEPVDVGAIDSSGALRSLRDCGEFYLVTEYAPGRLYAEDLRRIARESRATIGDVTRCDTLADYLAKLHADQGGRPQIYTRAIRDLLGHGEGIFGIIDGYPEGVPAAPRARLDAIEQRCVGWRGQLRGRERRLARIHGDFHPFNILFDDEDEVALLDASRGSRGDPANDVTCLALNYVFFALDVDGAWDRGFSELWFRFWRGYMERTGDVELLAVAPPFLAWRALVMSNPAWYPALTERGRDRLLRLVERALDESRFDPEWAEEVFE